MSQVPLVVDLDGTLVDTDMLHELAIKLFSEKPLAVLGFPAALRKGKANLKRHISARTNFAPELLPYNEGLLAWLREEHAAGRDVVLCTASDQAIAQPIAEHLGIFSAVMASDGQLNLSGDNKAQALVQSYGYQGFDYCGNASIDLLVWKDARQAIAVNASQGLLGKAAELVPIAQIFSSPRSASHVFVQMLRHYRWLRNLLVFVPVLLGGFFGFASINFWAGSALLYLAGSALPMLRDLLVIERDREAPSRRANLFASGQAPILFGVIAVAGAAIDASLITALWLVI